MQNDETPTAPKKVKQPPVLFTKTQALIDKLSSRLGGPVVAYWNGPRGSVCQSDVVALYHVLERLGQHETIYLFLKSSGGSGQVSLRLVNLLRQHCERLVALVPLECASAATMVALGADGIQMGPTAYLTAVDTSLNHALSPVDRDNDRVSVSLNELQRVIRLWREQQGHGNAEPENAYKSLFQYVHPLVIGAVDRAESLSIMLCHELLAYHVADDAKAAAISTALNGKYPSHSYPILLDEAVKIGLCAERMPADVNGLLLQLNACYSEMGQKATTDFDEVHAHSNEIVNIWESAQVQVYYQEDKDWFYRTEERRWITMNDHSGWRRIERVGQRIKREPLHVA
ncbi:MAG: hypothetical protein KKC79_09530 [Gammaproteobacteria bacterium]|nr:hypothetical protein [Gammaproteobacteria bacterium]MBU1442056.1 hypothetical protein [Gammaproteobacteria bacterium]MBU2287491.1 hypothetical protein [Gammaproteobacteria bacterium]MBU2408874.1 hypothetical protein [Gammaproteobacteria bacterium]